MSGLTYAERGSGWSIVDDWQPRIPWRPAEDIPIPDPDKHKHWKLDKDLDKHLEGVGVSRPQWIRNACTRPISAPAPGTDDIVTWIPGHRMDMRRSFSSDYCGPCEGIKLMIIVAAPEAVDSISCRHLNGAPAKFLKDLIKETGMPESEIYVTSVSRFAPPHGEKKTHDKWYVAGYELVAAEAMAIKPKAILCMGAPAVKALFGKRAKVTSMRGSLQEWEGINVIPSINPLQFMSGYAGKDEWEKDVRTAFTAAFGDVSRLLPEPLAERKYYSVDTAKGFEDAAEYILSTKPKLLAFDCEWGNDCGRQEFGYTISCQVSWGPGTACYFALQRPGVGNDHNIHSPDDYARCVAALDKLLVQSDADIGGQNLPIDVEELLKHGINLRKKMRKGYDSMVIHHLLHQDDDQGLEVLVRKYCPRLGAYWQDLENFLDASTAPKTDEEKAQERKVLEETGKKPEKKLSRAKHLRYGYRDIPEEILIPYAQTDSDATYRCIESLINEWSGPEYENLRNLYFNTVQPASDALLEIKLNGLNLDIDRMDDLHSRFQKRYDQILSDVRALTNWGDEFNPGSPDHIAQLLFSDTEYKKSDDKKKRNPAKGKLYKLKPVCNTDKYPQDWERLEQSGGNFRSNPSTKAESMKIIMSQLTDKIDVLKKLREETGENDHDAVINEMAESKQVVSHIHDLKVLGQFLRNFLKVPRLSDDQQAQIDETKRYAEEKGYSLTEDGIKAISALASADGVGDILVHEDGKSFRECHSQVTGRVSGTILQTTDTGRCRMFAANLQVFPKKQEKEIERIVGKDTPKVKSCVIPREPGDDGEEWVVTEADFRQAENWIMAIAGYDKTMLAILVGGRDLHSENCYHAFKVGLPLFWGWNGGDPEDGQECEPDGEFEHVRSIMPYDDLIDEIGRKRQTIEGVEGEGVCDYDVWAGAIKTLYPDKRTAAKTISFGVPYGRGAGALAREIRKAGIAITDAEASELVDAFYATYPGVEKLLEDARAQAIQPGLERVETLFGRRRYFTGASSLGDAKQSSAQREAGNFPIQGCVADLLYQALNNFMAYLDDESFKIEFKMCLVVHDAVVIEHRKKDTEAVYEMIKDCMSDNNAIPHTNGMKLGVDIETFGRWGEHSTLSSKTGYQPELSLAA